MGNLWGRRKKPKITTEYVAIKKSKVKKDGGTDEFCLCTRLYQTPAMIKKALEEKKKEEEKAKRNKNKKKEEKKKNKIGDCAYWLEGKYRVRTDKYGMKHMLFSSQLQGSRPGLDFYYTQVVRLMVTNYPKRRPKLE